MGNDCTTCSLNPNHNGDETEYSVDNRLPVSFLHGVEDEDINQEILLNTVDFLKNLDDGKNKTGEIQVPPESDSITYIRSLPIIFQNLYKKIHDKFGYFDTFDISSRKDKFKVEMGPPMEITVLKKNKGKRDEISLHPVTQTKFGPTNVRFEHKTPSRVDRREITMAEIQIPSDLIVKSELHEYYEGEWRKKKYHGFGRLVTVEGHVYEGFFSQGFPWGKGRVLYNNGNYFKGYFERGEYSGQGELYSTNGSYLKGEFFKGNLEGKGKQKIFIFFSVYELHKDGSTFDGMYKNGKKNGEGILVLSNRDKIAGEFKDNFLDGKGNPFCLNPLSHYRIFKWKSF